MIKYICSKNVIYTKVYRGVTDKKVESGFKEKVCFLVTRKILDKEGVVL